MEQPTPHTTPQTLPNTPGVGFKPQHLEGLLETGHTVGWVEVHAENHLGAGGRSKAQLHLLATRFPISVHGVGLSIGGEGALDTRHLARVRALVEGIQAASFSEHLAWSTHDGAYLNDLLPLPYTQDTLERVCGHIDTVQNALGRRMLLENPSSYMAFAESTFSETDFLGKVVERTGCGLLLDINNVFVSSVNLGLDPMAYIRSFPLSAVGELHLAGHDAQQDAHGAPLLIDAHGSPVAEPVWALYAATIALCGPKPSLIEWDNDVPPWEVLRDEAAKAEHVLARAKNTPTPTQAAGL
jgi:uncharacterized protein (UPF0276 family)